MNYQLNLREVTYALSEALDYVGIDDTMHGKRVAFMAAEIAKKLGWNEREINDIIMIGMLHDCGVSSTDVHLHLVNELDWNDSYKHCERGAELLQNVQIFSYYSQTILYHHTHWDEFPEDIDEDTKRNANLIYLVDRVDALRVQLGDETEQERHSIFAMIEKYSGSMFSPELVEAFLICSSADSFWFYMDQEALNGYFDIWMKNGLSDEYSFELLKNIAMMFASVVDAKSTFTTEHSYGVASVGVYIARLYGLSIRQQEIVLLSALLHDLGKLRVADAILQKQGPLNDDERQKMNRHGFDSHMILRKIKGFDEIANIASLHHEHMDATGYPYHLSANEIPIEARVLAVADIFQALIQDRPYRKGMLAGEALAILQSMGTENKIDTTIVAVVSEHLEKCYDRARNGLELF
ncbi:MAG: HD domain-containing protein [Sulfuricurvum sp.]|nr:HD domain-containing protein [Sulfuricurvum sp.]